MVISEKRSDVIKLVRSEYSRVQDRITNEIVRRVALGTPRFRVLGELVTDIVNGDFDISPSILSAILNGDAQVPSVSTIRQAVDELQSEMLADLNASGTPISPIISPHQRRGDARDIVNLGNAMRNLNSEFSGQSSSDNLRDLQSDESWRTATLRRVRMLMDSQEARRRNAEARARSLNELDYVAVRDPNIPIYQYDATTFRASELTLTQSITVMSTFDFDKQYERIKLTLLMYSLKIYGLEDCPREDLRIAVYLFIEEHFKIQPVIELCVRPVDDHREPNVVGVLFNRTTTVSNIIENRRILNKTRYRVSRNHTASWIIWNYDG